MNWLIAAIVLLVSRGRRQPESAEPGPVPRDGTKAELIVLAALGLASLGALVFVILYFAHPDTQWLGLALGLALAFAAVAAGIAGKRVVPQETLVEPRPQLVHPAELAEVDACLAEGGEGVTRKRLLLTAAGGTGAAIGGAMLVPALSLGPNASRVLAQSPWRRGTRLVGHDDRPVAAADIEVGSFVTAFPEGADKEQLASPVVVVHVRPDELDLPDDRRDWAPQGLAAFSKICTHAGCAVAEFRYPLYDPTSPGPALVCPCHFSTFSVATGGTRIFGPAGRSLPQLPLAVDTDGNLVAAGDFSGRVGPSWWGVRET